MAPPVKPLNETQRGVIYDILCEFARKRASLPCEHSIYRNLIRDRLNISRTRFKTLLKQLIEEDGLVMTDSITKTVSLTHAMLTMSPVQQRFADRNDFL